MLYGRPLATAPGERFSNALPSSHSPEQPLAVGEIAERLPVSRPAVSQHLKVLKETGLVSDEAVGARNIYRLNPAGVSALRDQLDTYWTRALSAFEATITENTEEP
jgi:DNA-binding transcriptional ArsR family regulator